MHQSSSILPAIAAIAAAVSAAASWWNTRAYFRNLRRGRIDECLSAALNFQGDVGRIVTLRERKDLNRRNIDSQRIWDAYKDAWASWRKFKIGFVVMRGYNRAAARILAPEIPKKLFDLLKELEGIFENDETWTENGTAHAKALGLVREVNQVVDALIVPLARPNA